MLKKLAAQTAIYGISSIIARFLNYLLTPYLTRIMTTGEYGVVTDLYALIPFILLLLTMGMETGYFHFAGKAGTSEEKRLIFQTTWGIVILVSLLFFGFTLLFFQPLSVVMDYAGTPSYLLLMGSIITVDAVTALPFAKLREENKASAYVKIRVVTILVNLFFCIVFYSVIPGIRDLQNIFPAEYGAGYYLISNLIASVTAAFMLIPAVRGIRPRIPFKVSDIISAIFTMHKFPKKYDCGKPCGKPPFAASYHIVTKRPERFLFIVACFNIPAKRI